MKYFSSKYTLFFHYFTLIILYAIANGLLFDTGSILTLLIPSIFIGYGFLASIKFNKYSNMTKILYLYMVYILILVCFSSNFQYSLKNALKSFLPLFYFILAINFVNKYKDFNKILKSLMIVSFIYLLNLLISNTFNLGGVHYGEDEEQYLQTGSIYSEGLNAMGYYLLLIPIILKIYPFKSAKNKFIIIISAIIIFITLLLVLKRGSLLIIVIGYLVYLNFSNAKFKLNIIKIASIVTLALLLTFPLYKTLLLSRFEVRESRLTSESYQTEGRYLENELVINDIFRSGNITWLFFGHEVFNSPGNYGNGAFGGRQLHNDYAQVLSGSGTIGLFLYLLLNISILRFYLKAKKRIIYMNLYLSNEKALNSLFWSFFITFFFLGLSGSITSILYNVCRYVILGSIIGIFIHKKHEQNQTN